MNNLKSFTVKSVNTTFRNNLCEAIKEFESVVSGKKQLRYDDVASAYLPLRDNLNKFMNEHFVNCNAAVPKEQKAIFRKQAEGPSHRSDAYRLVFPKGEDGLDDEELIKKALEASAIRFSTDKWS